MGRVAITIDDELHARARALQVGKHPKVTWEQWIEAAIRDAVERQEAEAERRRRSR